MLPTKFQDSWPFVSGEEVKIGFQDNGHDGRRISDRNDFNYSRLSLSRSPRDSLKYFEISVLRHIRFAELRKKNTSSNQIS